MATGAIFAKRERPQSRSVLLDALGPERYEALRSVLAETAESFGATPVDPRLTSFVDAAIELESAWQTAKARWRTTSGAEREQVGELVLRLGSLERTVRRAEIDHRDDALKSTRAALARLQDISSVGRLLEAGTEAVCSLGFDRAIISRIDKDTWVTEALHVDGDAEWALEILEAGQQNPQQLAKGLPEYEIVRRRRAILVKGVQERSTVHQALASSSGSRSYVAAPLMPGSTVIGFVHADRFFHQDDVTTFDRDVLHLFCEGFGYALERALLLERLGDIRTDLLSAPAGNGHGLATLLSEHAAAVADQADAAARGRLRAVPDPEDDARLTRREMDVLRLLATGSTNTRIAHRLVISESTVKSHVKSILRKLGASNRAEAVARWHKTGADGP